MSATVFQDIGTVITKELKEFFASGGSRGRYLSLFVLGLFGILLPLTTGSRDSAWVTSAVPVGLYGLVPADHPHPECRRRYVRW